MVEVGNHFLFYIATLNLLQITEVSLSTSRAGVTGDKRLNVGTCQSLRSRDEVETVCRRKEN